MPYLASTIKVDALQEKTSGNGVILNSPLLNSSGTEIISAAGSFFVGMIAPFAMSSTPSGWLPCQGGEVLITDYQDLYDLIGTTWNTTINPTTGSAHSSPAAGYFRLPDFRGSFLRGVGTASGKDAVTFAGYQTEKTKRPATAFTSNTTGQHYHGLEFTTLDLTPQTVPRWGYGYDTNLFQQTTSAGDHSHSITGGGDNETRPLNFGVYYWIKY